MRQIKSFMNSVLHLVKITEFEVQGNCAISAKLVISTSDINMFGTDANSLVLTHSNGNRIHYVKDNISNKVSVSVLVSKFGYKSFEHSCIDLDIKSKDEYFNYTLQNNPGEIMLDDIPVLKEIRDLALKVLNNEKTV